GEYERSIRHLLEANALKRQRIVYDEAATLGQLGRIRETFTPELMHEKRGLGNPSPVPVFIIGMPRSGTTLIEQILASHPKVFGANELFGLANLPGMTTERSGREFPEGIPALSGEQLRELGATYLQGLRLR